LEEVARLLRESPEPWVDRETIERLLGIGTRRAQQILAPCVGRRVGVNGLAERETLIAHLRRLAAGEAEHYERRRRISLARRMEALYRERKGALLVAAPASVMEQRLEELPEGVSLAPGSIRVRFDSPRQALERLLALAMAIRNDPVTFEILVSGKK
jgi:hypothetical protein